MGNSHDKNTLFCQTTINSPVEDVWEIFADSTTWKTWWGGELQKVEPGWQSGAKMHWKGGDQSRLLMVVEYKEIGIKTSTGEIITWIFKSSDQTTNVSIIEDLSKSIIEISNYDAALTQWEETLTALKNFVESRATNTDDDK